MIAQHRRRGAAGRCGRRRAHLARAHSSCLHSAIGEHASQPPRPETSADNPPSTTSSNAGLRPFATSETLLAGRVVTAGTGFGPDVHLSHDTEVEVGSQVPATSLAIARPPTMTFRSLGAAVGSTRPTRCGRSSTRSTPVGPIQLRRDPRSRRPVRPRPHPHQLDAAGVEYLLVGGLAAHAHGAHRRTMDVDCVPNTTAANLERLALALRHLNARLRVGGMTDDEASRLPVQLDAATLTAFGSSTWMTDAGPLDLLVELRDAKVDATRTPSWWIGGPLRGWCRHGAARRPRRHHRVQAVRQPRQGPRRSAELLQLRPRPTPRRRASRR